MPLPKEVDKRLTGSFTHGSLASACLSPLSCCAFCLCEPCALFSQRRRILRITGEPYVMFAGTWPCCGFEQPAPDCCLVCEVCMFPSCALAGNRFMVQTRFDKKNTAIDNCCTVCQCCVGLEFSCLRVCCECSEERENLVKSHVCVLPAAHCQNAFEIREYELGRRTYTAPPQAMIDMFPEHFKQAEVKMAAAPVQMQPM